jgi:hypothetical protein
VYRRRAKRRLRINAPKQLFCIHLANAANGEKLRALPSGPGVGFRPVRCTRRLLGRFEAGCARALGGLDARLG